MPLRVTARTPLFLAATTLVLAAAGCASSPDEKTEPAPRQSATAPPPVVTPGEARKALADYVATNNRANANYDAKLLGAVETGPLYEQSKAQYKQSTVWSAKERKHYREPFYYKDPVFYIPRPAPTGSAWFAAVVRGSWDKDSRRLLIFSKTSGTWKIAASVDLDEQMPKTALDRDGYAAALAPKAYKSLALDPGKLADAVNDNYATGGKNAGTVFAKTEPTRQQRKVYRDHTTYLRPHGRSTTRGADTLHKQIYALKTADSCALVVATSAHQQADVALTPGGLIEPGGDTRAWVKDERRSLRSDFTCINSAAIPRGAEKVRLLGYDCELVNVS